MPDPLRQHMLARMGIQSWQLRRPDLLENPPSNMAEQVTLGSQAAPTGKLWVVASQPPCAPLLADICQLLALSPDQVSLLAALPSPPPEEADRPLVWLTAADPAWPDALICPLDPGSTDKRALWQQLRLLLANKAS